MRADEGTEEAVVGVESTMGEVAEVASDAVVDVAVVEEAEIVEVSAAATRFLRTSADSSATMHE